MKIKTKILAALLGMSLLVALVGAVAIERQRAAAKIAGLQEAENVARLLSFLMSEPANLPASTQDIVEKLHRSQGRDVVLVDVAQRIVAGAVPEEIGQTYESDLGDEVGQTIRDRRVRTFVERSADYPKGVNQIVVPVESAPGEVIGAVVLEYTPLYEELMLQTRAATRQVALIGCSAAVLAILLSLYMGRAIGSPLDQLTEAAVGFAAGRTDLPMPASDGGEIGRLAAAFSTMRDRRQQAEEALRRTGDALEGRVVERTCELATANGALKAENAERKQAEDTLRASEEKFRQLADNITDVFWITSADLKTMHYVSAGYGEIWGRSMESLYAHPQQWIDAVVEEDRARVHAAFGSLMADQPRMSVEYRIVRDDGAIRFVHDRGFQVRDAAGELVRLTGIVTDITERKQTQEALERQQAELRVLFDLMPALIWFKDAENRILRVNQRVADAAGRAVEEIEGKRIEEIYPAEAAQYYADDLEVIRSKAPKLGITEELEGGDGEKIWIQTDKVPYCDKEGIVIGIVVLAQDVTIRNRAEAALRESEHRYRQLIHGLSAALYTCDTEGRITLYNEAAAALWGRAPELGKDLWCGSWQMYDPEGAPLALEDCPMSESLRTGQSVRGRPILIERPDGSRSFVLPHPDPIRDESGRVIGAINMLVDLTDRKRAEAEREQLNQQLVHASRLAGMAEVATSVLHNVGNVLNSVNISATQAAERMRQSCRSDVTRIAGLLERHGGDLPTFLLSSQGAQLPRFLTSVAQQLAEEQRVVLAELQSLRAHIDHIKEIVAMQQNYARIAGVIEELAPASLVEDALRMNAGALERHRVEVVREYAETPLLEIDKHKALQILVNLIRNAKYAIDDPAAQGNCMTLRIAEDGAGRVEISVCDEGVGIPAENLTRIFEHGFTTRKDGHGFGLHSAALAAREMGGSLTVRSDGPGQGAVFTLSLPLP